MAVAFGVCYIPYLHALSVALAPGVEVTLHTWVIASWTFEIGCILSKHRNWPPPWGPQSINQSLGAWTLALLYSPQQSRFLSLSCIVVVPNSWASRNRILKGLCLMKL